MSNFSASAIITVEFTKINFINSTIGNYFPHTKEPNDTTLTSETEIQGIQFNNNLIGDFDGESFSGYGGYFSLERHGRDWGTTLMYNYFSYR